MEWLRKRDRHRVAKDVVFLKEAAKCGPGGGLDIRHPTHAQVVAEGDRIPGQGVFKSSVSVMSKQKGGDTPEKLVVGDRRGSLEAFDDLENRGPV